MRKDTKRYSGDYKGASRDKWKFETRIKLAKTQTHRPFAVLSFAAYGWVNKPSFTIKKLF